MNPATIIRQSASDGVILALTAEGTIKATGDQHQVNKWVPVIREHKISIITALKEAVNDVDNLACFAWLIHFTDREPLTVTFSPEATHREVLASYPGAVAAEPMPEGHLENGRDEQ